MNRRKRFNAVILVCIMLAFTLYQGLKVSYTDEVIQNAQVNNRASSDKDTLYFWYTDEALTDYLNSVALSYMEEHEEIRVVPTCVSSVEYMENIYEASLTQDIYPDLFVVTNDCLQKAYLSGIATQIKDKNELVTLQNYPQVALSAVTCQDKLIAYPFYYDTALLLYNRTYLESMASAKQEALLAQQEGEAAQAQVDALLEAGGQIEEAETIETTEEEAADVQSEENYEDAEAEAYQAPDVLTLGAQALIPNTMEDILNLADEYDAPEGVEAIMKWDVSDIFYNYFFAGNYMQLGGENGDDPNIIDLNNDNSVQCLNVYQSLNQFFSIEAKETTYDSVLSEFMEGKIIYSVVTTDAITKLEQAKEEGTFTMEYDIVQLPDVNNELKSRGLSVTNVIAVNGFGQQKAKANDFAAYLAGQTGDDLYQRCGKLSTNLNVSHENEKLATAMEGYKESVSLPKLMQASNFWVQLEVTLTGIWQGDDVALSLQRLQEQMESQVK